MLFLLHFSSTENKSTPSCCRKDHSDQPYLLYNQHASMTPIDTPTRPSPAYQPRPLHCREQPSSMTCVATPTRLPPAYQSTSTSMFQFSFAQFYDISQLPSVTSNIPSIRSISKSHVTSSPHSDNGYAFQPRQHQVPATSQPNHVRSTGYHSNNSVSMKELKQTHRWIDSDSDDSPSKDKTLECLAQWCWSDLHDIPNLNTCRMCRRCVCYIYLISVYVCFISTYWIAMIDSSFMLSNEW